MVEKLIKKHKITQIYQNKDKIELFLPVELSNKINGEKLFLQTYNINPNFKLKYQMKKISISLLINTKKRHYIYDFIELLKIIEEQIE